MKRAFRWALIHRQREEECNYVIRVLSILHSFERILNIIHSVITVEDIHYFILESIDKTIRFRCKVISISKDRICGKTE